MGKLKIALDAGHGLHTAGRRCMAAFDSAETREWQLNDRIMDRLQDALQGYACEVLRVDDITGAQDVALSARVAAANAWGADIYMSMHHNGGIGGGAGGGTVVYHDCSTPRGIDLAQQLYDCVVASTGLVGNRSSKVVKKAYYVLANTRMYAYLVENGFMDSAHDTPIIITEDHATKTVAGILDWLVSGYGLAKLSGAEEQPEEDRPLTPDTDPADLAVGAEVIVRGAIYATGKGTGKSIAKNGDRMYIVGYAGESYPYCWGVAKTAGGTRQGWARAEDLELVLGADESLEDGSSVEYFPATAYAGSSLIDGLKAVGAENSYTYRKEIAAANEVVGYTGSAAQNSAMLKLLKAGKLIKP
jgi:N-acetylmuramoyl-L-alanine amidase